MAFSLFKSGTRVLLVVFVLFSVTYCLVAILLKRRKAQRYEHEIGTTPPIWLTDVWQPKNGGLVMETIAAIREHRWLELINKRHEAAGYTYQTTAIFGHFIHTSEPENIKAMLATKFDDWDLGNRMPAVGPLLGKGVFTNDGKDWEVSRGLVRPSFAKAEITDLSMLEGHVQQLIAHIPKDSSTFDLQELFLKLAFDYSSDFLFGESVHSFTTSADSDQARFVAAFNDATSEIPIRLLCGSLLPIYDAFSFRYHRNCRTVHHFVDNLIARAWAKRQQRAEKGAEEDGRDRCIFLEGLMDAIPDNLRLRSELLNMLMAGRDTTSGLLSHVFYLLARRPDVWTKLEAEVAELEGRPPTYAHLKTMTYLRYVMNETMRVYPVPPISSRIAVRDTVLPIGGGPDHKSPIFAPKGQVVSYPMYAMPHRKDIYGADADDFRPERWGEPHFRPGWAYIAFSGGPRLCVGQQFALTEVGYTTVRLVQTFLKPESRDPGPYLESIKITLSLLNGVQVGMTPRASRH